MVGSLFAQDIDTSGMSEVEKQMLFKQNDKSILLTYLLSINIPTAGHAWNGDWVRGFKPNVLPVGFLVSLGVAGYIEETYSFYNTKANIVQVIAVLTGISSIASWYLMQIQDAVYLAKTHNASLYKQIYGRDYPIQPKKSVVQKMIDKKEAKKSKPE